MDKRFLVEQLSERLRASARMVSRPGTLPDPLQALDHAARLQQALRELEAFEPPAKAATEEIGLGAILELEDEEGGHTFFMAPTGHGEELTMPGGDGFMSVLTPYSDLGQALLGRHVGEWIQLGGEGEERPCKVTFVA